MALLVILGTPSPLLCSVPCAATCNLEPISSIKNLPNHHSFRQFTDNCRTRYLRLLVISQRLLCDFLPGSNSISILHSPFSEDLLLPPHPHHSSRETSQRHAASANKEQGSSIGCTSSVLPLVQHASPRLYCRKSRLARCVIHCAVRPPDSPHPIDKPDLASRNKVNTARQ